MKAKRKIELLSAGCAACDQVVALVQRLACSDREVTVRDPKDALVATPAKTLGIKYLPSVVVDGVVASCCSGATGPEEASLRAMGIGSRVA